MGARHDIGIFPRFLSGKQNYASGMHLKAITAQSWQWRWGGCRLTDKTLPGTSDLEEILQSVLQVIEH
jgi:hypothetical protein